MERGVGDAVERVLTGWAGRDAFHRVPNQSCQDLRDVRRGGIGNNTLTPPSPKPKVWQTVPSGSLIQTEGLADSSRGLSPRYPRNPGPEIDQSTPQGWQTSNPRNSSGAYVSAFAHAATTFLAESLITEDLVEELVSAAAQSSCGAKSQ